MEKMTKMAVKNEKNDVSTLIFTINFDVVLILSTMEKRRKF